MNFFNNLIKRWRIYKAETHKRRVVQSAKEIFQLTEFNSALWFTYNGNLFCPAAYFGNDYNEAVALVNTLRELYVERNTRTESEE